MDQLTFVLASGSPRRQQFMTLLGVPFVVIPPQLFKDDQTEPQDIDETPLPGEHPVDLVQRLSQIKAQAVLAQLNQALTAPVVIAADTVVVLGQEILGKPRDAAQAKEMLQALREHPHFVYTGLTVALSTKTADELQLSLPESKDDNIVVTRLHRSTVQMRSYTDQEIEVYVAGGDPLDKAGAYGIQNETFAPVAHLDGCFASVMGFPANELAQALAEVNIFLPPIASVCKAFIDKEDCCQK